MYKLVAIDMDGTLLDSYGNISSENKNAIKKVKEKGTEVVLCSGRMVGAMQVFADEIEANNYIISGNGAQIYDVKNDKIIYDQHIEKNKVLDIIKVCEENSIYCCVYTENMIIAKSLN